MSFEARGPHRRSDRSSFPIGRLSWRLLALQRCLREVDHGVSRKLLSPRVGVVRCRLGRELHIVECHVNHLRTSRAEPGPDARSHAPACQCRLRRSATSGVTPRRPTRENAESPQWCKAEKGSETGRDSLPNWFGAGFLTSPWSGPKVSWRPGDWRPSVGLVARSETLPQHVRPFRKVITGLFLNTRSHAPAWECRLRRSASSGLAPRLGSLEHAEHPGRDRLAVALHKGSRGAL